MDSKNPPISPPGKIWSTTTETNTATTATNSKNSRLFLEQNDKLTKSNPNIAALLTAQVPVPIVDDDILRTSSNNQNVDNNSTSANTIINNNNSNHYQTTDQYDWLTNNKDYQSIYRYSTHSHHQSLQLPDVQFLTEHIQNPNIPSKA